MHHWVVNRIITGVIFSRIPPQSRQNQKENNHPQHQNYSQHTITLINRTCTSRLRWYTPSIPKFQKNKSNLKQNHQKQQNLLPPSSNPFRSRPSLVFIIIMVENVAPGLADVLEDSTCWCLKTICNTTPTKRPLGIFHVYNRM